MSDPYPLAAEDFTAFFEELTGYPPFPWQRRLARRVLTEGWPALLDLPTGTGKTAAIEIAVFTLAVNAGVHGRNAPRRIVYVVDRRVIVDQAHQRALDLERQLAEAPPGSMRARVAERLRLLTDGAGTPLQVARLRGGVPRSTEWARRPDQPLVVISTVDQVGSRLLFRGYGVSRSMRPVHAGLLGADCLYLLDEVHLSQPFRETLQAIAERYQHWAEFPVAPRIHVVEMSATPGERPNGPAPFGLDAEDRTHAVLRRRLEARKPTKLLASDNRHLVRDLVAEATALAAGGQLVAVVVNRVATARDVARALEGKVPRVTLITGRMRPVEREAVEVELAPRIRVGRRDRAPTAQAEVVVATQCIEAGADFDFDGLVSECASLDALRQRFGRLDRVGEYRQARGAVVGVKQSLVDDPIYGEAIGKTWAWLNGLADRAGEVDFQYGALPEPAPDLLAPRAHAPVLLPSHLDTWTQTSDDPAPEPDVAIWLHGPDSRPADVQLVWRTDIVSADLEAAARGEADLLRLRLVLELLPPSTGEVIPVPIAAARAWLAAAEEIEVPDVEGGRALQEESSEFEGRLCLVWDGEEVHITHGAGLRPGQTVVVPAEYGGISSYTWDPSSMEVVVDIAEHAALAQRGRGVLRMHPAVLKRLAPLLPEAPRPSTEDAEDSTFDERGLVLDWLTRCEDAGGALDGLPGLLEYLKREGRFLTVSRVPHAGKTRPGWFVVMGRRPFGQALDVSSEGDKGAFSGVAVPLQRHSEGVEHWARDLARAVGLDDGRAADLRAAACWHDLGKCDPRFQRLLHGGSEYKALVATEPLAKSATLFDIRAQLQARTRSGYPSGARHELLSMALVDAAPLSIFQEGSDRDLILHLIASHHGHCRPFAPVITDPDALQVEAVVGGARVVACTRHGLERLDSGVSRRFWRLVRRYGWWGLAWLEMLLRIADHRQSESEVPRRKSR